MPATPQTVAIQNVNQLIQLGQSLMAIYNNMLVIDAAFTDDAILTTLSNMQTVAQNADGTLGANDATPNSAHPLNITQYTSLSRAISPNQVTALKSALDNIVTFVNGSANVVANASIRSTLNAVVGG